MREQSSQQIPQEVQLKFADEHIVPILNGEKTMTLRVGLDSTDFKQARPISFCDTDGALFAEAAVEDRGYTTVEMAANMHLEGHRNYDGTDELLEELKSYYPDNDIDANTRVDIIRWGELW